MIRREKEREKEREEREKREKREDREEKEIPEIYRWTTNSRCGGTFDFSTTPYR